MKNMFDVTNKVVIITGASRGLGKAMALGLANAGAGIVAADVQDVSKVVKEVTKKNENAIGLQVDVTKRKDIQNMVEQTLDQFGSIDILVNNAGVLMTGNAENIEEKNWRQVMDVNLTGQFLCAQAVGKQMIKQKSGKIINISSIAGISGYASSVPYSASKAGVILLTKTLAAEWGEHNIQVNAVCPGVFATDMTADLLEDDQFVEMIKNKVPLGRHAEPEELIGTVIYLSSDASDYVTGHALVIDGGWTAGL